MAFKGIFFSDLTDLKSLVAEREFVAIVRLPAVVCLDGGIYILKKIEGIQGIYESVHYYRLPDTPIEEESEKEQRQRWELSND